MPSDPSHSDASRHSGGFPLPVVFMAMTFVAVMVGLLKTMNTEPAGGVAAAAGFAGCVVGIGQGVQSRRWRRGIVVGIILGSCLGAAGGAILSGAPDIRVALVGATLLCIVALICRSTRATQSC